MNKGICNCCGCETDSRCKYYCDYCSVEHKKNIQLINKLQIKIKKLEMMLK